MLGMGQQQRGQRLARWCCGAMPLLLRAPSQRDGGAQGRIGHTMGRHSLPRGPPLLGWGRRAVLMSRLEGWVGPAVGCCSQWGLSWLGGRRAAWGQSWLRGQARRSFQRGSRLEEQVRWAVWRARRLEGRVDPAVGRCALPAGHPQTRGAVRWGEAWCLPLGTVAPLQHKQSRTDGH